MQAAKEYHKIIVVFIVVFILHTTFMWLLIRIRNVTPSQKQNALYEKPTEKNLVQKPWVKLQSPPASPVLFKTMPQTAQNTPPQDLQKNPLDNKQTPSPQVKEQNQEIAPKTEQKFVTQNMPAAPLTLPTKKASFSAEETPEIKNATPRSSQNQPPSERKPSKLSFNNLMQGFANHLQEQQATDNYTMRGKATGKATAEQIRYAQYGSKICSTIHNAFLTNNNKSILTVNENRTLAVKIIINKDGSLHNAQILRSSDSGTIDRLVLTIINSAAQSFPPLPQFFNMEQCPFVITINNALQVIEHPEQSYWTL